MTQSKFAPIRLPILIGVSGQRRFAAGDAEREQTLRGAARQRLGRLFAELDRLHPSSPKIVITGGAAGADLLAAEAALERPEHWHVAILLPFDLDLFEEDFDSKRGFDQDLATLKSLIASGSSRLTVKTFPLLAPDCIGHAPRARLSRESAFFDATYRRAHYEQVGQWIAEAASLFIAVTADLEKPGTCDAKPNGSKLQADGGTARIVEVRRRGRPDAPGMAVARQSAVLRQVWPVVPELAGEPVWRLDPSKVSADGALGIEVLEPCPRAHRPPRDVEPFAASTSERSTAPEKPEAGRIKALAGLARAFERFNASFYGRIKPPGLATLPANPCDAILTIRESLSRPALRTKSWSTRSFAAVTLLFLAAITLYEVYAKLFNHNAGYLALYVFVFLCIWGVVYAASRWHLQSRAEDYRAVSELLRIQRAWWASGLPNRVDREHLQGADPDLSGVRNAVTSILSWVWLKSAWADAIPIGPDGAPYRNWNTVYDPAIPAPRPNEPDNKRTGWIPEQASYFAKNHHKRETLVQSIEAVSWFFFVAGGLLAALVLAWKTEPGIKDAFEFLGAANAGTFQSSSFLPPVWAVLTLVWLQDFLHARVKSFVRVRTVLLALLLAMSFALLGWSLGHILDNGQCKEEWAKKTAIFFGVFLPALAGAIRYYSEKLGFEAEALQYREAQGWFARAWDGMAEIEARGKPDGDGPGSQADKDRQALVLQLGRLALKENEAWLKTRRERPLTPVSG